MHESASNVLVQGHKANGTATSFHPVISCNPIQITWLLYPSIPLAPSALHTVLHVFYVLALDVLYARQ